MLPLPYALLRPVLFSLEPETAHDATIGALALTQHSCLKHLYTLPFVADPVQIAGLQFPNRVGLAAGLDKNARCIDAWAALGFGFIEVGTVTPEAQGGNPKPRMFRLHGHHALINRMGFNNAGIATLLTNIQQSRAPSTGRLLGVNIGKNASTPMEHAVNDYLYCLRAVYPVAHYIALNISSPNTRNLRALQDAEALSGLLSAVSLAREELSVEHKKYVPVFVKISPDLSETQIAHIAQILTASGMDGVIATNTTIDRAEVQSHRHAQQSGGLSGAPVHNVSNRVIAHLRAQLDQLCTASGKGRFPIIGVGGIFSGEDALAKLIAGADLVQIYTGLIYRGPRLVQEVAQTLGRTHTNHCTQDRR